MLRSVRIYYRSAGAYQLVLTITGLKSQPDQSSGIPPPVDRTHILLMKYSHGLPYSIELSIKHLDKNKKGECCYCTTTVPTKNG